MCRVLKNEVGDGMRIYEELSQLRATTGSDRSEVNHALEEFRSVFIALADRAASADKSYRIEDNNASQLSAFRLSTVSNHGSMLQDSMEVSAVLEKYSDRLLEIVASKIAAKKDMGSI